MPVQHFKRCSLGAVSSVVEHYLDTVGVRGSKPLSRTIFPMPNPEVSAHNRRVWDERVRRGRAHTQPASEQDFQNARAVLDECGWLPKSLKGLRVLCLAAGGGRHGPLFASLGAEVTVVDFSPEMLALDRQIAAKHGLKLKVVETSMDDLACLPRAGFDLIIQPVSTCYIADIEAVYREIAQVSIAGGFYISQHKQPMSLQCSALPEQTGYVVKEPLDRRDPLPPSIEDVVHREGGAFEFIHPLEKLLGGLCRAGFVIEDVIEPRHGNREAPPGTFGHRSCFVPPYVTVKARLAASNDRSSILLR